MKEVLIVFHSMTGGTRQMAQAAARGAATEAGVRVRLLRAAEAGAEDVLRADGYLFATPENLAAMSGVMKDFFDRTYYAVLDKIAGRCLLSGLETRGRALLTTGRVSSEMLQKAARLSAPILISRTSPSSLSIEMAERYGITLIGYARTHRFNVYSNPQRVGF